MRLDKTRPYGHIHGMSGLSGYEQDGKEYRLDGSLKQPALQKLAEPPAPKGPVPEGNPPEGNSGDGHDPIVDYAAMDSVALSAAYKARFGKNPPNRKTALQKLAEPPAEEPA